MTICTPISSACFLGFSEILCCQLWTFSHSVSDSLWYFIVVLVCIFVTINDMEHFFVWLLAILLNELSIQVSCPVFKWGLWLCFIIDLCKLSKYSGYKPFIRYMCWDYFLPVVSYLCTFLVVSVHKKMDLTVMRSTASFLFFYSDYFLSPA